LVTMGRSIIKEPSIKRIPLALGVICLSVLCASAQVNEAASSSVSNGGTPVDAGHGSDSMRIGLVIDHGGIDDGSFNQATWAGIVRFARELELERGTEYTYLQASSMDDYVPRLIRLADEGFDLIVAPGFLFERAIDQVTEKYMTRDFLIIDSVVEKPNVASAIFAENEGAFLAGVIAGLKGRADGRDVFGFLGGMEFPLIERYEAGFTQGVKAACPGATVLVDYAGNFGDPGLGRRLAASQYDAGAYIIFHAAGDTGIGLIHEASVRSSAGDIRWAIGCDVDQYADGLYGDDGSAVLTSIVKRVDVAAYDMARRWLAGSFPGGKTTTYGLSDGGLSLPERNPNLDPALLAEAMGYVDRVISGAIVVAEEL